MDSEDKFFATRNGAYKNSRRYAIHEALDMGDSQYFREKSVNSVVSKASKEYIGGPSSDWKTKFSLVVPKKEKQS